MKTTLIKSKSGFSLMEVMVAVTISAFILTSAYAAIISLATGSESLMNYSEMNSQSRKAIELFGRDARATANVNTFSTSRFTLLREVWTGSYYADRFVTYDYVSAAGTFSRIENSAVLVKGALVPGAEVSRKILLYDVEELNFKYYRLYDPEIKDYDPIARTRLEVKHVQIEAKLLRNVLTNENTNYIISARFMMRNKNVGE